MLPSSSKHRRHRPRKPSNAYLKRNMLFGSTFISIGLAVAYAGVVLACLNGVFHEMTEHDCKAGVSRACEYLMMQ